MTLIEANGANSVTEVFRSNVEDLALEELGRLEARKQQIEAELAEVNEGVRAAKGVLRSIRPQMKPGPKKPSKASGGTALSQHRREELTAWLTGKEDEFTNADVAAALSWSGSQAATAMILFRDEGLVRISRMTGKTGALKVYRSMV